MPMLPESLMKRVDVASVTPAVEPLKRKPLVRLAFKVLMLRVLAPMVPAVMLVSVVEARVDEPLAVTLVKDAVGDETELPVMALPAMLLAVTLVSVVEARVEEPETVRLVRKPVVAVMVLRSAVVIAAYTDERPSAELVPVRVEDAPAMVPAVITPRLAFVEKRFVEEAVEAKLLDEVALPRVAVLVLMVFPAMVCAVMLVSVVEARVDEPETVRLVKEPAPVAETRHVPLIAKQPPERLMPTFEVVVAEPEMVSPESVVVPKPDAETVRNLVPVDEDATSKAGNG